MLAHRNGVKVGLNGLQSKGYLRIYFRNINSFITLSLFHSFALSSSRPIAPSLFRGSIECHVANQLIINAGNHLTTE